MRIEVWCKSGHDSGDKKKFIKGKRIRTVYRECIPRIGDTVIVFNAIEEKVVDVVHHLDKDGTKIFIEADYEKYYKEV